MKIIALEHELPEATAEGFQKHAKDEARQVWALVQAGVIRETYFRVDRSEAVLVLECPSVDEAAGGVVYFAVCPESIDHVRVDSLESLSWI